MWKTLLMIAVTLPIGFSIAYNIEDYSNSLRGSDVMAMCESAPDDLMAVPQPMAVRYCCPTNQSRYYSDCSGNHVRWMQRGPVRRWFSRVQPARRVLRGIGRLFGLGGWRCR